MKKASKKSAAPEVDPFAGNQIVEIPLADIQKHPKIPNRSISKAHVESLTASIKANGLEMPLVIWNNDGANVIKGGVEKPASYLCAGFHRFEALSALPAATLKKLHPDGIPCYVIDGDLGAAVGAQVRENMMRKQFDNKEAINMIARLSEEFEKSNKEIATIIGKTAPYVSAVLKCYNELDESLWNDLCDGYLTLTDATALARAMSEAESAPDEETKAAAKEKVTTAKSKLATKKAKKVAAGTKNAPKRVGTATLIARYKALPPMSSAKKILAAETVIFYIAGDIDDLPPELMPVEKPKATAPAKKATAKKASAKKATKKKAAKK